MSISGLFLEAQSLAQEGLYEQALEKIMQHLQLEPCDGGAWNEAGVLCLKCGRTAKAVDYLEYAAGLSRQPEQVYLNLFEACIVAGLGRRTTDIMRLLGRGGLLKYEMVERAVKAFLRRNDRASAGETAAACSEVGLNDNRLSDLIETVKSNRARIAFFCGGDGPTFLKDIYDFVSRRFETRFFEGTTTDDVRQLMEWSDISWFEWCTNLAAMGSLFPKTCKNIIRLHRYEAYMDWPAKVNWDNIDALITVGNNSVRQALSLQVPDINKRTKIFTIPNGVNLERIKYSPRCTGCNIAFAGNIRMVKNPALLLQCIYRLHSIRPEYKLFIAGLSQDAALEQYLKHMVAQLGLGEVVFFDGWQEDIQGWLADKNFIVCTSVIESQGMGLLEAMAAGIKPVIHNFPDAGRIFPEKYLFNTPEQFCEKILSDDYNSQSYREFVERRYPLSKQLLFISELLADIEADCNLENRLGSSFSVRTNSLEEKVLSNPSAVV